LGVVGVVGALPAGLQAGGALGHLLVRLVLGGATDMLTLGPGLIWNLADIALAVGTATPGGQHAFIATLDDNTTGVYRVDPDGILALIVKTGMTTPLGAITGFGPYSPPALNSKGQAVVSARFDNGPDTLVLLTPAAP